MCFHIRNNSLIILVLNIFRYDKKEFALPCAYIEKLLPTRGIHNLEIEELSQVIHLDLKRALAAIVWGDFFHSVGSLIFCIGSGPLSGKYLSDLGEDIFVTKLSVAEETRVFHLERRFSITLNNNDGFLVKLDELSLWKFLYTNRSLSDKIGREGCFILDFTFNMGGSEALAETFFGIMKHQYKDNSSIETADMRTIVSHCFPDVSKCSNVIAAISKLYREGAL